MRLSIHFLLIALSFIIESEGQTKSLDTLWKDYYNQGKAFAEITSGRLEITNVTYSIQYLDIDGKLESYLVKQTENFVETTSNPEAENSKITLDIFALKNGQFVKTISKNAYSISFSTQFIHSYNNGGCFDERCGELSSINSGETFLKFSLKYYTVEIPNSQIHLYFGFSCDARDESNLILGELYYACALPIITQGKGFYYTLAFKKVNKIIFKASTKEVFAKIEPSSPEMTLRKSTDKDNLEDSSDFQTLMLWSYDKVKSLSGVNFPGLKIKFYDGESNSIPPIEIPFKDGLLFGDSTDRTIYIDK